MAINIDDAVSYHRKSPAGKLAIVPTKPMATQQDLALAYSPGVADACMEIVRDNSEAFNLTAKANLVGVITNGTAVLGLGSIGPQAAKPVMEGKAVLFKKFSNLDCFDIEVDETDPDMFVETVARLEPTFGGINLEDIKSPECFVIEEALKKRMNIPVFHDDQHGTAIVAGAAVYNGLRIVGKDIKDIQLVTSGAGAAALSCLDLLVNMGLPKENITVTDIAGVVYEGRTEEMDPYKARYAKATDKRTLAEVIEGADVFLGLSAGNVLKPEMLKTMADKPIVMALANPVPEIMPDLAREARPDAIIATGRSDFPNQVNNVLCFPFIFRGALDVGATTINEEMKVACLKALADLAMAEITEIVQQAYNGQPLKFGPDYLIPKPFDPRLIINIAPAVAKAAIESGVATRPIENFDEYRHQLARFAYRSSQVMAPVIEKAKKNPKRVVFTEGESVRVLRAVQLAVDAGITKPILLGRQEIIEEHIEDIQLRLRPGVDIEIIDIKNNPYEEKYVKAYFDLMCRNGVAPGDARQVMHTDSTSFACMMVLQGDADAMICGARGRFRFHLKQINDIIGVKEGIRGLSTMTAVTMQSGGTLFFCDTHINQNPTTEEVADTAVLAAEEVARFGIIPKIALLCHSNFGTNDLESAVKMRGALPLIRERLPEVQVEGEIHADAALNEELREQFMPNSGLKGAANLMVMPNLESGHITQAMMKELVGGGISIGPILLGAAKPVHLLGATTTARSIFNMTAVAVVNAQMHDD